jgi:DNA repair exonuclease SbcCD nuclease subunit
MQVAIITDQHFGARNDSVAFLDYMEEFYKNEFFPTLDENNIDTLLVLGDTFDRRKYVNFYALDRAKKMFFEPLGYRNIKTYMLVGNHDTYFKNTNDVNSPELLLEDYNNIEVINDPTDINIDGVDICMMPWICPENYQQSIDHMKATKADICMGHFEIAGFAMHRGQPSYEGLDKKTFDKFDIVYSGHYHHRSTDNHITYLGNPYELTWQDFADPRGFHLFDLQSRRLDFRPNPYTMFERIEYDDKAREPIDLATVELAKKFVKVVVVNKTDYYKFDKFINELYTKGAHDIKIIEDLADYDNGEVDETINLEDTMSVLSDYIDSIETDADKEHLKNYMRGLYTEAVNLEVV